MKEVAEIWKTFGDDEKKKYIALHEADIIKCEEEKKAAIADGTAKAPATAAAISAFFIPSPQIRNSVY